MIVKVSPEAEQRLTQIAKMAGVSAADYAGAMLEERVYHLTRHWDMTEPPAFNTPLDDEDEDPDALQKAIDELLNRSPEEIERDRLRLLASSRPPRPLPEGKTLYDVVYGQWPGDESDEEVFEALKKLS